MRSTRTTLGNLRRRSPHFRTITPHPQSNPTRQYLTLSSVSGPTNIPLATETLSEYFTNTVLRDHASRPALIARKELARAHGGPPSRNLGRDGKNAHLAWDFAEFDAHIQAVARGLIAMGVQRDDRVGVIMGNNRFGPLHLRFGMHFVWLTKFTQFVRLFTVGVRQSRRNTSDAESRIPFARTRKPPSSLLLPRLHPDSIAGVCIGARQSKTPIRRAPSQIVCIRIHALHRLSRSRPLPTW